VDYRVIFEFHIQIYYYYYYCCYCYVYQEETQERGSREMKRNGNEENAV
jgi:hypothetical protein